MVLPRASYVPPDRIGSTGPVPVLVPAPSRPGQLAQRGLVEARVHDAALRVALRSDHGTRRIHDRDRGALRGSDSDGVELRPRPLQLALRPVRISRQILAVGDQHDGARPLPRTRQKARGEGERVLEIGAGMVHVARGRGLDERGQPLAVRGQGAHGSRGPRELHEADPGAFEPVQDGQRFPLRGPEPAGPRVASVHAVGDVQRDHRIHALRRGGHESEARLRPHQPQTEERQSQEREGGSRGARAGPGLAAQRPQRGRLSQQALRAAPRPLRVEPEKGEEKDAPEKMRELRRGPAHVRDTFSTG